MEFQANRLKYRTRASVSRSQYEKFIFCTYRRGLYGRLGTIQKIFFVVVQNGFCSDMVALVSLLLHMILGDDNQNKYFNLKFQMVANISIFQIGSLNLKHTDLQFFTHEHYGMSGKNALIFSEVSVQERLVLKKYFLSLNFCGQLPREVSSQEQLTLARVRQMPFIYGAVLQMRTGPVLMQVFGQ